MDKQRVARELVALAEELFASKTRHCHIYRAKDGLWYMELAHEEYAGEEDATTYGPFPTEEAVEDYLGRFANPGYSTRDGSGRMPVPKRSPNGDRVVNPKRWGASRQARVPTGDLQVDFPSHTVMQYDKDYRMWNETLSQLRASDTEQGQRAAKLLEKALDAFVTAKARFKRAEEALYY